MESPAAAGRRQQRGQERLEQLRGRRAQSAPRRLAAGREEDRRLLQRAGQGLCAGAEAAAAGGRPPRPQPPEEAQEAGGAGARAGPARPSSGRRQPAPCKEPLRRCASLGPAVGGHGGGHVQSNRRLIRNALERCCLQGDHNREQREQILRTFDDELHSYERFVVLFRSVHTGRHDLRALYGHRDGAWVRVLQLLPSPLQLEERMVVQFLRFDSGSKEFREMPALQEFGVADAVFLQPQHLQKLRAAT